MSASPLSDECVLKWCNEAGDHVEHRLYVTSLFAWRSTWLIGVNLVQDDTGPPYVELTVSARFTAPVIVKLGAAEAEAIGKALLEASTRATG